MFMLIAIEFTNTPQIRQKSKMRVLVQRTCIQRRDTKMKSKQIYSTTCCAADQLQWIPPVVLLYYPCWCSQQCHLAHALITKGLLYHTNITRAVKHDYHSFASVVNKRLPPTRDCQIIISYSQFLHDEVLKFMLARFILFWEQWSWYAVPASSAN